MFALPPDPLVWGMLIVSGSFAVAFVLELAGVPRTLRDCRRCLRRKHRDAD